ncbi:ABC transporter permease [Kaistia geumhonensis]|uniref:Spermidine/putrescine transport system permease protein n=1 Tax=Kaistia geumhonensis TaxID=410839 RepID=A0ABU0M658_9HYPH|nr:ABC transporter permease [Kaistia geumhonensis]MCX5478361.1 ABC transporter permease [Kaistia geumhonensis]MDQ0516421.1 putative spermidine/putrescine transport system permease protein [Kaistia geumhonensis]
MTEGRSRAFYILSAIFALYVLFLYGPTITILVLSFQGPSGGMTFPMNGVSLHWFHNLWAGIGVPNVVDALLNSLKLGLVVTALTVVISIMAGYAFRRRFRGQDALFFTAIASLILPSIIVSLGIALEFQLVNQTIIGWGDTLVDNYVDIDNPTAWTNFLGQVGILIQDNFQTVMGLFTSGLGAHLTWTLPFGLLIMFAVFNRFNPAYEEAARDLGASPWQTFRFVVLPIILPSLVGVALFGFTLSWDEIARSSQAVGSANTLPLTLRGLTTTVTTPVIYALGTVTTAVSFAVIALAFATVLLVQARRRRNGSDAGKGV